MDSPVPDPPTKVLYIAGSGRSGSNLLANLLGSVDGVFSAGEVRFLWERGLRDDRLCGCGRRFSACPMWQQVMAEAVGYPSSVDVDEFLARAAQGGRIRHLPFMFTGRFAERRLFRRWGDYPEFTGRLYPAMARLSGCSLVVDSSKVPAYEYLLQHLPTVDLHVVHLIRDPRATAYSWQRPEPLLEGASSQAMEPQSVLKSTLLWDVWNWSAVTFSVARPDRYLRLRYEDLVLSPRPSVERILEFVGHDRDAGAAFVDDHTVRLAVSHTVAGDPDRLCSGVVALRLDDEWTRRMARRDRAVASLVTGPLRAYFAAFPMT